MSEKYKVIDSSRPTFITLTLIDWVDLFTRKRYCLLMDESLNFCVKEKGLIIHAYVYMSNHIHLIVTTKEDNLPQIVRDFKSYTSKQFIKLIKEPGESRREWLLDKFSFAANRIKRNKNYKVWKDGFHPKILDTNKKVQQTVNYVHYNPVTAGICYNEGYYVNSSFLAYTAKKNVRLNLPVVTLF